jgi:dihydrofolate reductase
MLVSIIAAVSRNGVIGRGNRLPWRISRDLQWFKDHTLGHPVIMGRKTFESMGRPLPDRINIVITSQEAYGPESIIVVSSLEKALDRAAALDDREVFVIGGSRVFDDSLAVAGRLYITLIHQDFGGDVFFPEYSRESFAQVFKEEHLEEEPPFTFLILERQTGKVY